MAKNNVDLIKELDRIFNRLKGMIREGTPINVYQFYEVVKKHNNNYISDMEHSGNESIIIRIRNGDINAEANFINSQVSQQYDH